MPRSCAALLIGLATLALPGQATAHMLSLDVRTGPGFDQAASCLVRLDPQWLTVVENSGRGHGEPHRMRWPVTQWESEVLLDALAGLMNDTYPLQDVAELQVPQPPYVSVTFLARTTDGVISGLYLQDGLALPPGLEAVVSTFFEGGPCGDALPA